MQIETIDRAQQWHCRQGKLEHEQVTVRLKHTRHLSKPGHPVFQIAQAECDGDAIE